MPFPNPENTDINGVLCVGGELTPERLIAAYSKGIFPWPHEGMPLLWFCPLRRGVLDFADYNVPKSVKKLVDKKVFEITFDKAFAQVIGACAKIPRGGETGTWILPEMEQAYLELHRRGLAHSVEAWQAGQLVGGLYGVQVNNIFAGESMFFTVSGASKVCLVHLVEKLKSEGATWIDIQMVTPVLAHFGGKYIARKSFLKRLEKTAKT